LLWLWLLSILRILLLSQLLSHSPFFSLLSLSSLLLLLVLLLLLWLPPLFVLLPLPVMLLLLSLVRLPSIVAQVDIVGAKVREKDTKLHCSFAGVHPVPIIEQDALGFLRFRHLRRSGVSLIRVIEIRDRMRRDEIG
jgi:hypothetical protein